MYLEILSLIVFSTFPHICQNADDIYIRACERAFSRTYTQCNRVGHREMNYLEDRIDLLQCE